MGKISFLAGGVVCYVLGTRAGEKRYEQIKKQADKAWSNPAVQDKVTAATETVKAKAPVVAAAVGQKAADVSKDAAHGVASKASDAKEATTSKAADAKDAVSSKTSGGKHAAKDDSDLPETIHRDSKGDLHADTSGFGPGGEKLP